MNFLYKLVELLTPKAVIGGLEVSDASLRYVRLGKANAIAAHTSLKLPAGIVVDGRIKDKRNFSLALVQLRAKIENKNRPIHIVLSIPSANVFAQTVFLVEVGQANIEEALRLNIQMISPLKFENAYYDWQPVKRKEVARSEEIEFLAAVVNKDIVHEFIEALRLNGFVAVAVEFGALSVMRVARTLKTNIGAARPCVTIMVSADGVEFTISRGGELYFDYFHSWASIRGASRVVTVDAFNEFILNETVRLVNFYQSRFNVEVRHIVLVASGFNDQISRLLLASKLNPTVAVLEVEKFKDLPVYWYGALGAALRGNIPRYMDAEINLSGISAKEEYQLIRGAAFVKLWRNLWWTSLTVLLAACIATWIFLEQYYSRSLIQAKGRPASDYAVKVGELQKISNEFNALVGFASQVSGQVIRWTPFLRRMQSLGKGSVTIERISINEGGSASIGGSVSSREAAIEYKNMLANEPGISEVSLPLSSLFVGGGGIMSFSISFKVADLSQFDQYK